MSRRVRTCPFKLLSSTLQSFILSRVFKHLQNFHPCVCYEGLFCWITEHPTSLEWSLILSSLCNNRRNRIFVQNKETIINVQHFSSTHIDLLLQNLWVVMLVVLLTACLVPVAYFGKTHKTFSHLVNCGEYWNRCYIFHMILIPQDTTCSLLLPMSLAIHWVCPIQVILEHWCIQLMPTQTPMNSFFLRMTLMAFKPYMVRKTIFLVFLLGGWLTVIRIYLKYAYSTKMRNLTVLNNG